MLKISIFDGEYAGDLDALTHVCDIEGSVEPHDRPLLVQEEVLHVLDMCEKRYSTPLLKGTSFTAFVGRKDGLEVTPLLRLDGHVHNGCASARVVGAGPHWDTEWVDCAPGDDTVAIVRKLLELRR